MYVSLVSSPNIQRKYPPCHWCCLRTESLSPRRLLLIKDPCSPSDPRPLADDNPFDHHFCSNRDYPEELCWFRTIMIKSYKCLSCLVTRQNWKRVVAAWTFQTSSLMPFLIGSQSGNQDVEIVHNARNSLSSTKKYSFSKRIALKRCSLLSEVVFLPLCFYVS